MVFSSCCYQQKLADPNCAIHFEDISFLFALILKFKVYSTKQDSKNKLWAHFNKSYFFIFIFFPNQFKINGKYNNEETDLKLKLKSFFFLHFPDYIICELLSRFINIKDCDHNWTFIIPA